MQRITILGSTGSIGTNTLNVISQNKEKFDVYALVAGGNWRLMVEQCQLFNPKYAVMHDHDAACNLERACKSLGLATKVLQGQEAACGVVVNADVDTVMSAIVGAAGLIPTLAAINAGKRILLANKESLVMSGEIFINAVKQSGATLLPIDSEHNAIFQAMPVSVQQSCFSSSLGQHGVNKILLTGSGGPFRQRPLTTFDDITVEQAIAHPNWQMGRKISVDSATMMNKGLEFIEAKWLFNAECSDIEVVIHPQSIIHSMVQYRDGSVIAQLGRPDMRTPIAHALAFPERIESGVAPLDFSQMKDFSFSEPDFDRYPNLKLAIDACNEGQYATTTINAANEETVSAFLNQKISFSEIFRINQSVLSMISQSHAQLALDDINSVISLDAEARKIAKHVIEGGV